MDSKLRIIIVAWDFTEKAEFAFAHAVNVAKINGQEIAIANVVKTDNEVADMESRLQHEVQRLSGVYGITPKTLVLVGSIFKAMSQRGSEGDIEVIIMGTHGLKGMQRFTGSWALKVIRGSRAPFLCVQEMPKTERFSNILFPIDFKKENKEKINWAYYLSKLHGSKIHIIHPRVADAAFKKRIYSNIVFAKKFFDNAGIEYTVVATGRKTNFVNESIEYAKKNDISLIMVMTSKTISLVDYLLNPMEQQFLNNDAKIPIMAFNPKPKAFAGGFSATGG
jgi:nucleotide-binding universal stress UspA family protein